MRTSSWHRMWRSSATVWWIFTPISARYQIFWFHINCLITAHRALSTMGRQNKRTLFVYPWYADVFVLKMLEWPLSVCPSSTKSRSPAKICVPVGQWLCKHSYRSEITADGASARIKIDLPSNFNHKICSEKIFCGFIMVHKLCCLWKINRSGSCFEVQVQHSFPSC